MQLGTKMKWLDFEVINSLLISPGPHNTDDIFKSSVSLRVRRSSQTIFSENACLWYTGWLKIKYPTRQYAISLNQWSDFKNSWNCLILTLLWIQQCTVYPLHLNYTTTLTCKIITMKITIFTGEFFGNTQIICLVTPENYEIISETLILLIFMFAELCLNATRHLNPSQIPSTNWRKSCNQYGMICHRTPSTRPYWALSKKILACVKAGVDTLNASSI